MSIENITIGKKSNTGKSGWPEYACAGSINALQAETHAAPDSLGICIQCLHATRRFACTPNHPLPPWRLLGLIKLHLCNPIVGKLPFCASQHASRLILSKCKIITLDDFRNIHTVLVIAFRGGKRKIMTVSARAGSKRVFVDRQQAFNAALPGQSCRSFGDARIASCDVLLPALQNAREISRGCSAAADSPPRHTAQGDVECLCMKAVNRPEMGPVRLECRPEHQGEGCH
ncbi:hypothetical protein ACFQFS_16475 [Novosphingobium lubricantis]